MENKLTKEQKEHLEKFKAIAEEQKAMREKKAEEQREKFKAWVKKNQRGKQEVRMFVVYD